MDMFTYYCIDGHVYHVCHICWFALPEALFLMLFQIRVFIEMVKLLEYKHFNIISHFVIIWILNLFYKLSYHQLNQETFFHQ